MQIATIAGNLGRDAELKPTQNGDQYCRFTVAVTTGWGDRKATTWWDVTRWGKGADKLAGFLKKGSKVAVSGEISTREHEGKTYLQLRADHVTMQGDAGGSGNRDFAGAGAEQSRGAGRDHQNMRAAAELDDDVPF